MNRKKRRARRLVLLGLLLLFAAVTALIALRFSPLVREVAENQVVNAASGAVLDAITEQARSGEVDFSNIVLLEKDAAGRITAIRTNMREIAILKAEVFETLDSLVSQMETRQLDIPLGSILLPEFFAGKGLRLPVRIISLSQSNADFYSAFQEAGINQTLQTISMEFSVDLTVFTPFGMQKICVSSEVVLAETVLLGDVPQSYIHLG